MDENILNQILKIFPKDQTALSHEEIEEKIKHVDDLKTYLKELQTRGLISGSAFNGYKATDLAHDVPNESPTDYILRKLTENKGMYNLFLLDGRKFKDGMDQIRCINALTEQGYISKAKGGFAQSYQLTDKYRQKQLQLYKPAAIKEISKLPSIEMSAEELLAGVDLAPLYHPDLIELLLIEQYIEIITKTKSGNFYRKGPALSTYLKEGFGQNEQFSSDPSIEYLPKNESSSQENQHEPTPTYSFPLLTLPEVHRKYLGIIYDRFLRNLQTNTPFEIREMWEDMPTTFHPNEINKLLLEGDKNITIWGIWHVDSNSPLFYKFDQVIYAIKNLLSKSPGLKHINFQALESIVPSISFMDMLKIVDLMGRQGFFTISVGRNVDRKELSFNINDDQQYDAFRKYEGLQIYYTNWLRKNGIENTDIQVLDIDPESTLNQPSVLNKTDFKRRMSQEFQPVLGVTALANDLAKIIYELPEEKGQMIGIFGKWGRGKSFLLEELWKSIEKQTSIQYTRVTYHAWKYQETPASWAYLYEILANEFLGPKKEFRSYYHRIISLNIKRLGWLPLLKFVAASITTIATGIIAIVNIPQSTWVVIPLALLGLFNLMKKFQKELSTKAIDLVNKYTVRHSFSETMGVQADIQNELIKLLKTWIKKDKSKTKKILLIVEDIDRCTEDRIIQNIDALRVMLEEEEIAQRIIIITAIDERILKNAIRIKYNTLLKERINENAKEDSIDKIDLNELISEYLDKLFISAIKLGPLTAYQKDEYIRELFKHEVHATQELITTDPIEQHTPASESNLILNVLSALQRGDIEIPDDEGGFASIQELNEQRSINERSKNDVWEKLSETEVRYLKFTINSWESVTPRKINIFYYRYLLCKNLLLQKYIGLNTVNPWQNENSIKNIMGLIRYYSAQKRPEMISKQIELLMQKENTDLPFSIENCTDHLKQSKSDWINLYQVLELVIAY